MTLAYAEQNDDELMALDQAIERWKIDTTTNIRLHCESLKREENDGM